MNYTVKISMAVLIALAFCFFPMFICTVYCATPDDYSSKDLTSKAANPSEAEKIIATLSDEQVRQMLLDELRKTAAAEKLNLSEQLTRPALGLASLLAYLSNEHNQNENQFRRLLAGIPAIPSDIRKVFITLAPDNTFHSAALNVIWILFFILIATMVEGGFKKFFFDKSYNASVKKDFSGMPTSEKITVLFALAIPDIIGFILFFATAYFCVILFTWSGSRQVQIFFMAVLIALSLIKFIKILARLVFGPDLKAMQILPMDPATAHLSYRITVWISCYIVIALMLTVGMLQLGAQRETVILLQLFFASVLLAVTAAGIFLFKERVRKHILTDAEKEEKNLTGWRRQFAAIWHIPAITYLFVLWLLLINSISSPETKSSGAFLLSFFVVPIWMVADHLSQWFVKYLLYHLKIHQEIYEDKSPPSQKELDRRQKEKNIYLKVKSGVRVVLISVIAVWVASLWNIRIPFISELAKVVLDSLIILAVALLFWQYISSWIEKKIEESDPQPEEETKENDEWSGTAKRGRTYTLLPIIRKFIGSILVVMVTLTIISSLGVDIGPLLAGAGVVGLAIGFGAQKLVSDIFSGFFYLLDDAFRVGEYIQAGNVSGSVEAISLRNVMLRHHRGMLQIIPHSELGAITNFMRGGIIVKFNLDFPYDAPIDKIRKIIKKVGQKMLENEEYGMDFIKPLKSQGVREIANSVMTIRVKFTAQPGSHFIIRREAYRLITEALNAKGIHYAHKKVIVDLPESLKDSIEDKSEVKDQVAAIAGAAAMQTIEEEIK